MVEHACRWVGNVHQRDDSDPQVAGCGFSEGQSGRSVRQKQIWWCSCGHGFWAQNSCETGDRLDDRSTMWTSRGCVRQGSESRRHDGNRLWQEGRAEAVRQVLRAAREWRLLRATRTRLKRTRWERSQYRRMVLPYVRHSAVR